MRNDDFNSITAPTTHRHHLICWHSTIAGLVLSILTFVGVIALAIAFGGIGLSDGATVQNAGVFAGVSVLVATILATFVGAYFAVRSSKTMVDVLGSAQGLVVGALFLIFAIFQITSAIGTIGKVAGQAVGATATVAGAGAAAASQNPMIQEIVEDNFGDLKTKSDASMVVKGTASRLLRGDQEGAKNYLAFQTGMTPAEADQRIATVKAKLDEAMVKTREATATAMKATGWSLFVMVVLGAIAAVLGGLLGAKCNEAYTIDTPDELKAGFRARNRVKA